jgi:transglutaminase-like putative cysteine protease
MARVQTVELFFQYSLLGLLASGYCALAGSGHLDPITAVLTGLGLLLRGLLIAGVVRWDIDPRWTTAATIAYIGFYPLDLKYISGEFIPATIHLICFLAVARVLTAQTNRDFFFVKVIAFMELLGATLLNTNLNFFFFLTAFMVFGVATFCCSEIRKSSQQRQRVVSGAFHFHRRLAGLTAGITLGIVVLTGGLFFILPRTARAAFRNLVSQRYHLPGFSNEVTLGQIGRMKMSAVPVMHVRIESPDERLPLKWRGAALSQFDGKRWYNPGRQSEVIRVEKGAPTRLRRDDEWVLTGPPISYQVRINAVDTDALFFPAVPSLVQVDGVSLIFRGPGGSYRTGLGSTDGLTYKGVSFRADAAGEPAYAIEPLPSNIATEHLLLPPVDRRIINLARREGQGVSDADRARAIEKYLKTNFGYTTELHDKEPEDPLSHFFFERKKGHCEYFASAMAVMLRAIHIPSRVVTGFQGGLYNPMTGWQVVRASDAHSWVEAWLPHRGWTTFDPTPPDDTRTHGAAAFWSKFMLYLDAADTLWQRWVVDYNLEQQIDLIARVEGTSRWLQVDWDRFGPTAAGRAMKNWIAWAKPYLGSTFVILGLCVLLFFGAPRIIALVRARRELLRYRQGKVGASDAALLYGRMLAVLRRRGLEKPAWLTPAEFAAIVPDAQRASVVQQFTDAYHDLRYARRAEAGPRMLDLLDQLERRQ